MDDDFYEIMLGFVAYMKEFAAFLCHIVVRMPLAFCSDKTIYLNNHRFLEIVIWGFLLFLDIYGHLKKYLSSECLLQLGNSWLKTEKQS